jgi:hypothetical protein
MGVTTLGVDWASEETPSDNKKSRKPERHSFTVLHLLDFFLKAVGKEKEAQTSFGTNTFADISDSTPV